MGKKTKNLYIKLVMRIFAQSLVVQVSNESYSYHTLMQLTVYHIITQNNKNILISLAVIQTTAHLHFDRHITCTSVLNIPD